MVDLKVGFVYFGRAIAVISNYSLIIDTNEAAVLMVAERQ